MATCTRLHDLFISDGLELHVKVSGKAEETIPAAQIEYAYVVADDGGQVVLVPDVVKQGSEPTNKGAYFLKIAADALPKQTRMGQPVKNLTHLLDG